MGDVYPGLQPVKWNEHEQKSAVVQILCQKGDTLVNVEIQKLTDVDRRRVAELRKLLKETLPTINCSFAAIFGGFAPSFKEKNHATFYSETGYVTAMAVKLKKICLGLIELLLLKSHTCISHL